MRYLPSMVLRAIALGSAPFLLSLVPVGVLAAPSLIQPLSLADLSLKQSSSQQDTARQLFQQGLEQYYAEDLSGALESFFAALELYQAIGSDSAQGTILYNIANIYEQLGQPDEALQYYEQALTFIAESNDREAEAETLNAIGVLYGNQGQYETAISYYEQGLVIQREVGDRANESVTLTNLGAAQRNLGQYEAAIDSYEQALNLQAETNDPSAQGNTLNGIGLTYYQLQRYELALFYYQQALVRHQDTFSRRREGETFNNIAAVYSSLGDYPQALDYYHQALTIQEETNDGLGAMRTLNNIGLVHIKTGNFPLALEAFDQVLNLAEEYGDRALLGEVANNLGLVSYSQGRFDQALELFAEALAKSQEMGDRHQQSSTLNNLGLVYLSLGQPEDAITYFQQALEMATDLNDRPLIGNSLNNLGDAYETLQNYPTAINYYREALTLASTAGDYLGTSATLNNVGEVYRQLGQYPQALEQFQRALQLQQEIGDRQGEAITRNNLGLVYANQRNYDLALENYQQALILRTDLGDRQGQSITLSNLGFLFADQGEPELGILFLKEAINRWEVIRQELGRLPLEQQQSFANTLAGSYRKLADLLLQENRILEAQQVLDLLKVQELDDYFSGVQRNATTPLESPLRSVEQEILDRFFANQDQLVALGRELRQLERIDRASRTPEQVERVRELRQLQQDAQTVFGALIASEEVQTRVSQLRQTTGATNVELRQLNALRDNLQDLEQNAVALYPLVLEDRLELVVVTADAPPISHSVPVSRVELNRAIAEFRSSLFVPVRTPLPQAQQLYDWLIRPIENELTQAGAEVIIYAPDAQLRYLPLAALHDGEQWLIQRWQVNNITASSLSDLGDRSRQRTLSILAAAFTEGQYNVPTSTRNLSFGGLPFAGREVEILAQLIPQTEQRLNQTFNQDIVLDMNDFQIVHLATHAAFNPGPPQDSFILFGDGTVATLRDLERWSIPNVELVVLSACQTAVGDVPLGDGVEVLGLGYQMQAAGADATIASLWSVDDGGTQMLMNAFYAALRQGMSRTEALQQAQIALITGDYSALGLEPPANQTYSLNRPYYWAPFILIGNGL